MQSFVLNVRYISGFMNFEFFYVFLRWKTNFCLLFSPKILTVSFEILIVIRTLYDLKLTMVWDNKKDKGSLGASISNIFQFLLFICKPFHALLSLSLLQSKNIEPWLDPLTLVWHHTLVDSGICYWKVLNFKNALCQSAIMQNPKIIMKTAY